MDRVTLHFIGCNYLQNIRCPFAMMSTLTPNYEYKLSFNIRPVGDTTA